MTRVLVTGASGFVGSHLARALTEEGHEVLAMTRHPDDYEGAGEPVYADVAEPDSLREVMRGVRAAYYLVHALDSDDFVAAGRGRGAGLQRRGRRGRTRADHLPRRPGQRARTSSRTTCGPGARSSSCWPPTGCR